MLTFRPTPRLLLRLIDARTVEADVASELAPEEVFQILEAPPLSLFARSSIGEAQLEWRPSPADFLRLFSYQHDSSGLVIQPVLSLFNTTQGWTIARARLRGAGFRYERQIIPQLSGFARFLLSNDTDQSTPETRGRQLPMHPPYLASVGLNFVNRAGFKALWTGDYLGARYDDRYWTGDPAFNPNAARPRAGGAWINNLRLSWEPTLRGEATLLIANLFNTRFSVWPGVPAPGRAARLEYRWRF